MINLFIKDINLRLITENDAKFSYNLRMERGENLSKTGSYEDQLNFIINYKSKENDELEYYFVIFKNDTPVGTVRVYNIDKINKTFTWGSWILEKNSPPTFALFSSILIYKFAFDYLKMEKAVFDVRNNNINVISFHLKTGAKFIKKDEIDTFFEFDKNNYFEYKSKYSKFLEK